jgi:predicted dehydrogenase
MPEQIQTPMLDYRPILPQGPLPAIAICGAGGIVNDAHLPAYAKAGFRVAGIYDSQREKAQSTAQRFGIEKVYDDLDSLAADSQIGIVDVAVPATENEAVVEVLAGRGKALLLQKPLCEDLAGARRICDRLQSSDTIAAVNQQMRWEPAVRACRGLLADGGLGALYNLSFLIYVDTPWHMWPWLAEKESIDVLYHSIHYLDAIRFLAGQEPEAVFCSGSTYPGCAAKGETRICLHLYFPGQLRATVLTNHHAAYGVEGQHSEFRLEGTEGAAVRRLGLLMDYPKGGKDAFRYKSGSEPWREVDFDAAWFPDAFIGPMASLMRAVGGEIERPETDVRDNLKTLELVFAAIESMRRRQVVEVGSI